MATMPIFANKNLPTIVGREEPSLPDQNLKICKIVDYVQVGRSAVRVINKGHGRSKKKDYTGYVNTSDLAQMTVTTVPIPANFVGLEAVDVPTRLQYQYFEIYDVVEEENEVVITARHIWYQNLQNNTLWKPEANTSYSASAVCRNVMNEAMFETDFDVASDCTDTLPSEELDFERKNLVEAFLDPENGICKKFGLSLIRDNYRFYCLKNVGYDRGFVVQYGKNLLGVEREESIENVATRIAPFGKDKKGEIVWLNYNGLKYIDSQYIGNYSSPRLELLDTGLQIGKDGVTADNIQAKLLEMAQKRFSEDEVDKPEVTMEIEFISLGDTEEYQQYRDLDKVYLYDIITIKDEEKSYNYSAQVIGIEHDILTGMLNSVTIGSLKKADASRKIAVWQVPEVNGANIRLLSIQAGSFAPEAIGADDLQEHIIRYAHFAEATIDNLNADAIRAITAEIETIIAGHITAESIKTSAISAINATLGTATITNGVIDNADIGFANIRAATAESLIARDAVTDRYYIDKLQVRNVQAVEATVGDLVVKASNGNYYRLDVSSDGSLSPTRVYPTSSAIAEGRMGNGAIIETDLTVAELSASNMKAINALIDKLTASRIDVDELFARSAFIGKLNTTDISSNTYLQLMVNSKNKTYRQWAEPSDPHDGDTWYKQAPQPISEMENYTHAELSQYPYWAFDGYQLYRYEGSAWRKIDDPAEIRSTVSRLLMENDRIDIAVMQLDSEMDNKYTVRSGIAIELDGIEISGSKYLRLKTGGKLVVDSGNFDIDENGNVRMNGEIIATAGQIGGYAIGATRLSAGSGTTFVGLDSGTASFDYAIWAGGETAASAPFRLKRDGTLTVTKLEVLNEAGTSAETINLRNYALWKLTYDTVKSISVSGNTLTITTTGGTTTFSKAARAVLAGSWSGNIFTVSASNDPDVIAISETLTGATGTGSTSGTYNITSFDTNHKANARVTASRASGVLFGFNIDATSEYNKGWNDCLSACGIANGGTVYTGSIRQLYDDSLDVYVRAVNPYVAHSVSKK